VVQMTDAQGYSQPTDSLGRWAFIGVVLVIWLATVIVLGGTRSAWMDEFAIADMTSPDHSLAENFLAWKTEPHPPIYTFLMWGWRHLVNVDRNILSLRAFGILASLILAIVALWYWQHSRWPGIGIFAVLMASSPVIIFFPEETRSYFLSVFGGVYISLYFIRVWENDAQDSPKLADILIGSLGAALLTTHLISLLFLCMVFAVIGTRLLIARRWPWLRVTLAIAIVIIVPAIVVALSVLGALSSALGQFWITRRNLLGTAIEFPFMVGAPVLALVLLAPTWRRLFPEGRERSAFNLLCTTVACLLIIVFISIAKPMIVGRYLVGPVAAFIPACAVLLAWYVNERGYTVQSSGRLIPWFVVFSCFVAGVAAQTRFAPDTEWKRPAAALNSIGSCNGAIIPYVILNHPPDVRNNFRYDFEWYAPNHIFASATPAAISDAATQACPVRLWIAHQVRRYVSDGYKSAIQHTCDSGNLVGLAFGGGYLVVDRSAEDLIAKWRGGTVTPCRNIPLEDTYKDGFRQWIR
jgi:hypothetical protein